VLFLASLIFKGFHSQNNFRPQPDAMGAVSKFPYPKHTWSPAGGWWNEPKNWKNRTGILFGAFALLSIPLISFSNKHKKSYSHLPQALEN
jgi:hypothetical protein